jgi:hypothetical protein
VKLKLTQAARKHRIGVARIAQVVGSSQPTHGVRPSGEEEFSWVGVDDRGLELEVIGVLVQTGDEPVMLIIHAMPTGLRRR